MEKERERNGQTVKKVARWSKIDKSETRRPRKGEIEREENKTRRQSAARHFSSFVTNRFGNEGVKYELQDYLLRDVRLGTADSDALFQLPHLHALGL